MMRRWSVLGLSVLLLGAGCTASKLTKVASQVAAEQGVISQEQKGAIDRTSEAFRESFEDLTEEEEFYLGRAVAAEILARYPLRAEDDLSAYVRRVGRAVAAYSPRPETYQGYRFAILQDSQPNAFAAPGGFVFVTTGLLTLVANEEQLAAVLAHEVAHVAERHGLASIQKSRLTDAFAVLGREAGTALDQKQLLQLVGAFEGAVGDVAKTLLETGYGRTQEEEADRVALGIVTSLGYRSNGLPSFLATLSARPTDAGAPAMFRSHPPSDQRERALARLVDTERDVTIDTSLRDARFNRARRAL